MIVKKKAHPQRHALKVYLSTILTASFFLRQLAVLVKVLLLYLLRMNGF